LVSSIDINGPSHPRSAPRSGKCLSSGGGAKYYRLTTLGRKQLVIEARDWDRMQNAITRVMKLA
jgi:hypothetical protein